MSTIQIKNVPPETHAVLVRRAAEAHQSLQEYLRQRLIEEAAAPTLAEIFDRIEKRKGGAHFSLEEAAAEIRALRGPLPPEPVPGSSGRLPAGEARGRRERR